MSPDEPKKEILSLKYSVIPTRHVDPGTSDAKSAFADALLDSRV